MAKADKGTSELEMKRSNKTTIATDSVTPVTTVNMDRGPMKRTTARYRPSMEKMTREAQRATRKYAAVRSRKGSIRSNLRIRAAQRATGIATSSASSMISRFCWRGSARIARAAEALKDACPPASYVSFMQSPPAPEICSLRWKRYLVLGRANARDCKGIQQFNRQ